MKYLHSRPSKTATCYASACSMHGRLSLLIGRKRGASSEFEAGFPRTDRQMSTVLDSHGNSMKNKNIC